MCLSSTSHFFILCMYIHALTLPSAVVSAANVYSVDCIYGTVPPDPSGLTNKTCNSTAEAYQCYAGKRLDGTLEMDCTTPQVCQQLYNDLYGQSPVSSPYTVFFCCSTNFCNDYKQLNKTTDPVVPPPGNYTPTSGGSNLAFSRRDNIRNLAVVLMFLLWEMVLGKLN